jgi:hypothetical protein
VASPYPTGTCTLQDSPGFARRDNVNHHRRAPLARPVDGFVSVSVFIVVIGHHISNMFINIDLEIFHSIIVRG